MGLLRKSILINSALMLLLSFSSCTINDEGELEFTWLFWAILIVFILALIISNIKDKKEADRRGITVEELLQEKQQNAEKEEMRKGLNVEYLGGYPKWINPCKVNFSIEDNSIVLKKGIDSMRISKDEIIAISNEKSGTRSAGKVATGAIVGGVLTGGIGLIVGGVLGAGKKDTSEIFVVYKYKETELTLNLRPGSNTDKIYSWINSVFA